MSGINLAILFGSQSVKSESVSKTKSAAVPENEILKTLDGQHSPILWKRHNCGQW